MRYDVHKYLFIGASIDKLPFLHAAQEAGIIEFIDPKGSRKRSLPDDIEEMGRAIKILRGYVQEQQDSIANTESAALITDRVLTLKEQLNSALQTQKEIEDEIERILPFGEFSPESLQSFETESKRKVRFFAAKSTKQLSEKEPALILIHSEDGMDYFIAIQNEPIVFQDLEELHFTRPLSELQKLFESSTKDIDAIHNGLKAHTRYYTLLHQALVQRLNEAHLLFAEETTEFELEEQLFIAEGWVPKTKVDELQNLCKQHQIYSEQIKVDKEEVPPTYLQNQGTAKVGEDLIRIFDTPSTRDKDPSLWVLFAFALFFSMIVYDAGYGLIFLAAALFLRFRMKKITPSTKRFIGLVAILSTMCILWGGLTHSFFGIHFEPESPMRKYSLMTWLIKKKASYSLQHKDETYKYYAERYPQIKNAKTAEQFLYAHNPTDQTAHPIAEKFTDSILLELSLLLGATHIIIGLLRYLRKNPVGLGWVAFIIGCYLYIPNFLNTTSIIHFIFGVNKEIASTLGLQLIALGVGFTAVAGVVLHGVAGMFEFTHAVQIFADVLSYLRIYALGYAGFIVSETVNMLGGKMPLIFAIVVIVFGHVLNMTIAILGGTIHGLRLNFLEWYRYSFFGGGKDFRPLQLMTLE